MLLMVKRFQKISLTQTSDNADCPFVPPTRTWARRLEEIEIFDIIEMNVMITYLRRNRPRSQLRFLPEENLGDLRAKRVWPIPSCRG